MTFNPKNSYWLGSPDGRSSPIIYSSLGARVVPSDDPGYVRFLSVNGAAIPWPCDESGVATAAALDTVLTSFGLPPTGLALPSKPELLAYAGKKLGSLRATPRSYALGGGVSVMADATTDTVALVNGLGEWGSQNPTATQNWTDDFGVVTSITGTQAAALKTAGLAFIQSLYVTLASVAEGVQSGSITTYAEVDAVAWP